MEEFFEKFFIIIVFVCLFTLLGLVLQSDRNEVECQELRKELEQKDEKIASLEKEIRLLKTDLYIEKYGFPEK